MREVESAICERCGAPVRPGAVSCEFCGVAFRSRNAAKPSPQTSAAKVVASIESALNAGKKIEAIKIYRQHTHAGLKESKEAIDSGSLRDLR